MRRPPARRRRPVRSLVAAATVVCAGSAAARAADTYPIKMHRPVTVGQLMSVSCKAEVKQSAKVTAGGQAQPDRTDKFTAELTGTAKVEAVNKVGSPTKVTVTIDKLTKDGVDVLPAGTVVTADHSGDHEAFTVAGDAVEPAQAAVLSTVIDTDKPDQTVTDDQMLGTPTAQPAGGTWAGDPAKLAATLNEDHVPVTADHFKVNATLVEVKPVDGVPSEVIRVTLDGDPLEKGKDVDGLTLTGGTFKGTMTQTLPADPAGLAETSDEHITYAFQGTANGGAVTADVTIERTVHRTTTPKK